MAMTIIAAGVAGLGVLVLLTGLVLFVKRMRLAGAVVALLGAALFAFPVLTVLYVAMAMR